MTEKEKRKKKLFYNANYDKELQLELSKCKDLIFKYNKIKPSNINRRIKLLETLFNSKINIMDIVQPFYCDFGYNIKVGKNFYANHNCTMLDGASITFGDNVFIGPNCGFYTAGHPINKDKRNEGIEYAYPINIGNDVWFGGNVQVMPGVTIGNNVVVGAGSIVTKDIPNNVIVAGNPAKILREITEEDLKR